MAGILRRLSVRLRFLFLVRYPVLIGVVLIGLSALAWWIDRELLGNLLVLETAWQLFNVTWLSFLVAAFVLIAYRVIQLNAASRFQDYAAAHQRVFPGQKIGMAALNPEPRNGRLRWLPRNWRLRWLLLILMGLPLPLACVFAISTDPSPHWLAWFGCPPWLVGGVVVGGGMLFAILLLMALAALQELLLDPKGISPDLLPFEGWWLIHDLKNIRVGWLYPLGDVLAKVLDRFGPGYTQSITDSATGRKYLTLAPGHGQAFLWLGATVCCYLASYSLVYRFQLIPGESSWFPALFFVLLVLLLVGCLLSGLSFLLDYTRFPVLLAAAGVSLVFYLVPNTDHYYELNPPRSSEEATAPIATPKLTDVLHKRDLPEVESGSDPKVKKRTLVVVTAAGGGIQASAWTTRVLSGLHECYGAPFTRSVGIISAVSGGSVGTMYYLANGKWEDEGSPLDDSACQRMREMSQASSLEAAAWGIAHPDFMRLFTPFLVGQYVDRGWAIEETWRRELDTLEGKWKDGDFRLRDWIGPIQKGKMPIPIFNATIAETGQRLLLSPVLGPESRDNATEAQEFFNLYSEANPRVTTTVRLSAAFSYVSPVSRPGPPVNDKQAYHVADGGYTDNEGVTTVIRWLRFLLDSCPPHKRKFDRILIVRILPFPTAKVKCAETHRGWLYELLGPLTTLENVRPASQTERNSLALDLLANGKTEIALAEFVYQPSKDEPQDGASLACESEQAKLVSQPPKDEPLIPLSWKLTASQKRNIDKCWESIRGGGNTNVLNKQKKHPMQILEQFFKRCEPAPRGP